MSAAKRIIKLAKERALFCFPTLVGQLLDGASTAIEHAVTGSGARLSSREESNLVAAQQFLRRQSPAFQKKLFRLYQQKLERAMQTIYSDTRGSARKSILGELSLVDDDTVMRDLDLDRVTKQFRTADEECLGLVNIMVAQMHGQIDVIERENPFRPYLLALSLHEVINQMVEDPEVGSVLIRHMAAAMVKGLPDYYAQIRAAFEARGVRARLVARPGEMSRSGQATLQRQATLQTQGGEPTYNTGGEVLTIMGASQHSVSGHPTISAGTVSGTTPPARILPSLRRLLDKSGEAAHAMQAMAHGPAVDPSGALSESLASRPDALQDLIWNLFHRAPVTLQPLGEGGELLTSAGDASAQGMAVVPVSSELLVALNHYQAQEVGDPSIRARAGDEGVERNRLLALREEIDPRIATEQELLTIDVVAVLFEFILEDPQIPAEVRLQIGRLQVPFLKAAVLDKSLLQDETHPARQLLNRLGSATVGIDPETAHGQGLIAEIKRLTVNVLEQFDDDAIVFANALEEIERYLADSLRSSDELNAQAIEDAEKISVLLVKTTILLRDLLSPLRIDARVTDFVLLIWTRVLVRTFWLESTEEKAGEETGPLTGQMRSTLAGLVWSAQEKANAEEKKLLLQMLPGLVKNVKSGLHMIQLPEHERQAAFDELVEVHTGLLKKDRFFGGLPSLTELHQHFSRLVLSREQARILPTEEWVVPQAVMEEVLGGRDVSVSLDSPFGSQTVFENDRQILDQLRIGVCIERLVGREYCRARLTWISAHKSLYLFPQDSDAAPVVFSPSSLLDELRASTIRLVEYAPIFDRAVDALMLNAEAIDDGSLNFMKQD